MLITLVYYFHTCCNQYSILSDQIYSMALVTISMHFNSQEIFVLQILWLGLIFSIISLLISLLMRTLPNVKVDVKPSVFRFSFWESQDEA